MMAQSTVIYLRIGEGKKLPAKDLSGKSDPYCSIKIDNEIVARTSTIWKTLEPFWGEEFTMFIPGSFTNLSVTVYDEDTLGGDDRIGKITFNKEVLSHCPRGVEKWFPLSTVYNDTDIQGELRLETTVYEKGDVKKVRVRLLEAKDLTESSFKDPDGPFVRLVLTDKNRNGQRKSSPFISNDLPQYFVQLKDEIKETEPGRSRVRYPSTQRYFEFESKSQLNDLKLVAEVLDRADAVQSMGEAIVFLSKHTPEHTKEDWYKLFPPPQQRHRKTEDLGSIRLKVVMMEECVLPSKNYHPLLEMIMEALTAPTKKAPDILSIMDDLTTLNHACVTRQLCKLFIGQDMLLSFMDLVTTREIQKTTSIMTLFRGNSLASKAVEQFMKIVGMPYLLEILKPTIDQVFEEHRTCELDPARHEKAKSTRMRRLSLRPEEDVISRSEGYLRGYLDGIMTAILRSELAFPVYMRVVFRNLARRVFERFGDDAGHEDQKYLAISGFLFLRFYAPAILGPKLFSLRNEHADKVTSRTLTLLAKIVQKIGNLETEVKIAKEEWMASLTSCIAEYSDQVRDFLDRVMDIDDSQIPELGKRRSVFDQSVIIKQGYLKKCRFTVFKMHKPFAFKKRYCWLTTENLLYANGPEAQTRQFLPTLKIVAVEKVSDTGFQKNNVFQVISEEYEGALQTLYLGCQDINEMNQWMSAIRKTIVSNPRVLAVYHPGIYQNKKWSCCREVERTNIGCARCNAQITMSDWRDPLDPDAEIQMIYTQLFLSRDELQQKYLQGSTVNDGESEEPGDNRPSDDVRAAIARLLGAIDTVHEAHRASERKFKLH